MKSGSRIIFPPPPVLMPTWASLLDARRDEAAAGTATARDGFRAAAFAFEFGFQFAYAVMSPA